MRRNIVEKYDKEKIKQKQTFYHIDLKLSKLPISKILYLGSLLNTEIFKKKVFFDNISKKPNHVFT
jgi:hypothetical protein